LDTMAFAENSHCLIMFLYGNKY